MIQNALSALMFLAIALAGAVVGSMTETASPGLRGDDSEVRSITIRDVEQTTQTLDLAGEKLEKAVGL